MNPWGTLSSALKYFQCNFHCNYDLLKLHIKDKFLQALDSNFLWAAIPASLLKPLKDVVEHTIVLKLQLLNIEQ